MKAKELRDLIFKLHRYIGLAVGLLLVLIGLTGSLLVFHSEIDDLITSQQFGRVTPVGQSLSPEKILEISQAAYPDWQAFGIEIPEDSHHPYKLNMSAANANSQIYLDGRYEIFINPYTGYIMGDRPERYTFYRLILNLHYRLFAEKIGITIVGITGLLLLILSITGVALWPGWRRLITGFKIKWKAHPKRVNFDVHKFTGIITSGFLVLLAFTGICYSFYEFTDSLINALILSPQPAETPVSQPGLGKRSLGLSQILKQADVALPNAQTTVVYLATSPEDTFWVYKKFSENTDKLANLVHLDQYTGKVLRLDNQQTQSLSKQIWKYIAALHFGTFGGIKTRILYVFLGIAPLILFMTGFIMWRGRKRVIRAEQVIE